MPASVARVRAGALAALAALLVVSGCAGTSSAGSCVMSEATASPSDGSPGAAITVSGEYWGPCNDTNHASDPPWDAVQLQWVQGDEATSLGEIDLDGHTFRDTVRVPADAEAGEATLRISAHEVVVDIPVEVTQP